MGGSKHILVVEEDGNVRNVVIEMLQDHNYRVTSVADGASMRDFLQIGDVVDCVVLDVRIPGEGGVSLALHLKESSLPVVIISGSLDAMAFAQKNNLQFLRKPFHTQELHDALNTALKNGRGTMVSARRGAAAAAGFERRFR
jgi:two-component system, OmpR family, response regulator